jgi:hypothetical protein
MQQKIARIIGKKSRQKQAMNKLIHRKLFKRRKTMNKIADVCPVKVLTGSKQTEAKITLIH